MITNSFLYIATLVFVAGILVCLPRLLKADWAQKTFQILSPITLLYLGLMLLCTLGVWNMETTSQIYSGLKNPILYAMLFLMLLRCNLKKILKLGPKMLIGFFAATISIGLGFVISYALFHSFLGDGSWKTLGALCGSWMGGGGNMLAIQAALDVPEGAMVYAVVIDSIVPSIYITFLLWGINKHKGFNRWTNADTHLLDEVGASLEQEARSNTKPLLWQNILVLLGCALFVSALAQMGGELLNQQIPFFDKATWTVLIVTALGTALAITPLGKIKGTEEVSNCLLYIVIALIASRADLSAMDNAPAWLLTGVVIMLFHVIIMLLLAKLLHMDLFTSCVASLANIGGTATAPVLAGTYSSALVPVGIIMALLGYVVGTGGGLLVAQIMSAFG